LFRTGWRSTLKQLWDGTNKDPGRPGDPLTEGFSPG
jgi:hypothetical protein